MRSESNGTGRQASRSIVNVAEAVWANWITEFSQRATAALEFVVHNADD